MYPLFLKLENEPCLVVGGGKVAQRKIKSLLATGASVHVIAPALTRALHKLVKQKLVNHTKSIYQPQNLRRYKCVISATNSADVNSQVYKDARKQRVLVNVVDNAELSDFYIPSLVRRGSLLLAISTSGKAPCFSGKFRRYLDKKIPRDWGKKLEQVYALREQLKTIKKDKIKSVPVKLQLAKIIKNIFKEMEMKKV